MYKYKDSLHYMNTCRKIIREKNFADSIPTNISTSLLKLADDLWFFCKKESYMKYCETYDCIPATHLLTISMKSAISVRQLEEVVSNRIMYLDDPMNKRLSSNYKYGTHPFDTESFDYLDGVYGVYKLFDNNKKLLYIGKSINLSSRILGSSTERKSYYYSYAKVKSMADLNVYEYYYISLLKPPANVEGVYDGKLTISLPDLEFSEPKRLREDDLDE